MALGRILRRYYNMERWWNSLVAPSSGSQPRAGLLQPGVTLCSSGSWLLSFSTVAENLPSQKCQVGLWQRQLLHYEITGRLLPSAPQASSCPLMHTPCTLVHEHIHTHPHSLSDGFLSWLLCSLTARPVWVWEQEDRPSSLLCSYLGSSRKTFFFFK